MNFSVFGEHRYFNCHDEVIAWDILDVKEAFSKLLSYRNDFYCVGFVSYEAHRAFALLDLIKQENQKAYRNQILFQEMMGNLNVFLHKSIKRPINNQASLISLPSQISNPQLRYSHCSSLPFLYFGIFTQRESFKAQASRDIFYPLNQKMIHLHAYKQKIQKLKDQIAMGNTYQGNFTTFFEFESTLPSFNLFETLLNKQDTAYRAFLPTPFGDILSFSPELFFRIDGERILTQPMKGTMPRGKNEREDEENRQFLCNDVKNRSENVMIVDLLRNDLSKITQLGSLRVSKLFEVETYPSLFQMTSSIEGKLKPHLTLFEVFQALFPCGSITGAPKKITTEILHSLEEGERGVYCGAIGVLEREKAVFSIPIRTIFREKHSLNHSYIGSKSLSDSNQIASKDEDSLCHSSLFNGDLIKTSDFLSPLPTTFQKTPYFGKCRYGVGSGIVWDSEPDLEYEELQTKMKFLKRDFCLLETILYTPQEIHQEFLTLPQGLSFLALHLERLQRSAKALGFVYPQDLQEKLESLEWREKKIIRLLLDLNGEVKFEILPFVEIESRKICIQEKPFWSDLESYKVAFPHSLGFEPSDMQNTAFIPHYGGFEILCENKLFDCVYHRDGILLEGMRSNLILELDGELLTPSEGILKGVCREVLIKEGKIKEAILRVEDLERARRIFCINSVRGIVEIS